MDKPYVISIGGGSGSGKTLIINHLRSEFPEDQLCIISLDDYYLPREQQQRDAQGVRNFDRPQSLDIDAFERDVRSLIAGNSVQRKQYTFNNPKAEPEVLTFNPAPVIVLEGLFIFYFDAIRKITDLRVFVEASDILKLIRRIKRDQEERNYPIEDVLYRYQHHVLPAYEKFIAPYLDEVDLILNNHHSFQKGLEVLQGFIGSRIR